MSKTVTTFCRICISACGIEVTVGDDNRVERIAPDKENPHTWRDFCAKARTAGELIEHPRRILNPMRRVGGTYVEATWEEAIADIAARKLKFKDIKKAPHGILFGKKEFGHLKKALKTPDKKIRFGSDALLAEARRQLAAPAPAAPADYPLMLSNRRHHDSMNSWLNELSGLHKHRRDSVVEINPDDAGRLGVASGDVVRISSLTTGFEVEALVTDATRPGVVVISHGWGSRVFDPRGGAEPIVFGVNRNSLVGTEIDPLSQTSPLNSAWVRVDPLTVHVEDPVVREATV